MIVGATSDGASVNTGIYNGLLTQFKRERTWLITIHCVSHRVELALKDSLLKSKEFSNVKDFMTGIFYAMKHSGQLKRQFKEFGEINDVTVYTFPKVHGTRFIGHQRAGVDVLLNNWIPFALTLENICSGRNRQCNAKYLGYLKKLKSYDFLCSVCMYKGFLDAITPMSQTFQKGDLYLYEIPTIVEVTKCHITDLLDDLNTNPINCYAKQLSFDEDCDNTTLVAKLPKVGHTRRKPENREYKELKLELTGCSEGEERSKRHINKLRSDVVPRVRSCLDSRFDSNDPASEVLEHMKWFDPANWVDDIESEVNSLLDLATHFHSTLEHSGFDFDKKNIKKEWRDLKLTAKNFYAGVDSKVLWQRVITYRMHQFPNVTKLVQIIMALGPSNAFVESAFSILNGMLNDQRLNLKHATMQNLFLIKANAPLLDKSDIIDKALVKHMEKRRKVRMEEEGTDRGDRGSSSSNLQQEEAASSFRLISSDISDSESDLVESDYENPDYFFEYIGTSTETDSEVFSAED